MALSEHGWIVLKYGGTSVSSLARWQTIENVVRDRIAGGYKPFVVCSALSGISNLLDRLLGEAKRGAHEPILETIRKRHVDLGNELGVDADVILADAFDELNRLAMGASLLRESNPRLQARVMAMGELMSTKLGAVYLNNQGLPTAWCDAREMLRAVDEPDASENRRYLSANCHFDRNETLESRLLAEEASVYLTQGFIAHNSGEETVLLGRGGSDTSAAYFAAKLGADRLEIWTDVPGMFTANPRQVPSARLLKQLGYDEAQELASMGAKVLHPRCLEPVRRCRIPLYILSTEDPGLAGTVISDEAPDFGAQVKAISAKKGITLISMNTVGMWQQVGFLADVFAIFRQNGLSVDLVTTSETNVTVSLDPTANALDPATIQGLLRDLNTICSAREVTPCASVSLVGRKIRSILDELGPVFEVFEEQKVYMVSQAASDLNLTFVVDEEQADRLVRQLHVELFSYRQADELMGPSWSELYQQEAVRASTEGLWWHRKRNQLVDVARRTSPVYVYDEETLSELVDDLLSIEAVDRIFYSMKANPNPDILRLLHSRGLGFECVSPGEAERIRTLFPDLDAQRILFTPNFAPREEYAAALASGIFVTLDNLFPLEAWPEVFAGRDLIVRVDPGRGRGHHKYVRTAGTQSKFGVSPDELDRLADRASAAGARIIGFHSHVGSGIKRAETWAETAGFLVSLRDRFPDVYVINVGGGLGVSEHAGVPPLDIQSVARSLLTFKEAYPDVELWLEPGRYPVASAGVLLARVTQLKKKGDVNYVGIDAGMNSLIRPALYGAFHEIVNLSRLDAPPEYTAEIVGPICETGDVLGHGRMMPATEEGDVVLIGTAGAYGRAMSSHYNLREPAGEYLLRKEA